MRNVAESSANAAVKNPSIIWSSSDALTPGIAGNSPSRSTLVEPPTGVYEWVNRAPSNAPPIVH